MPTITQLDPQEQGKHARVLQLAQACSTQSDGHLDQSGMKAAVAIIQVHLAGYCDLDTTLSELEALYEKCVDIANAKK